MEFARPIDAHKKLLGDLAVLAMVATSITVLILIVSPSSIFEVEHRVEYSILIQAESDSPEMERWITSFFSDASAQDGHQAWDEEISVRFDRLMGAFYEIDPPKAHDENAAIRVVSARSEGLDLVDWLTTPFQEDPRHLASATVMRELPVVSVQSSYGASSTANWLVFLGAILSLAALTTLYIRQKTFIKAEQKASPSIRARVIAIVLPTLVLVGVSSSFLANAQTNAASEFVQTLNTWMSDPMMRAKMFIAAVIFSPVFEELLCRRFIFHRYLTVNHLVTGYILSAFLFVWIHVGRGAFMGLTTELIYLMLFYFAASLLLCYTYFKTRSILDAMLVHALYNLIVLLIWFWMTGT